jgi:cell fate regulator YaaT (PSP1 superfamily)
MTNDIGSFRLQAICEYLVSHGQSGAFGRFAAEMPMPLRRGDRVVVRGSRGLELGTVLCPTSERQQRLLSHVPCGQLLRSATDEDESLARQRQDQGRRLADETRALVRGLAVPLEILDAEILLDGRQAIVQCLAAEQTDLAPLLAPLESQFQVAILLENLAVVPPAAEEQEHAGCGQPGCGRTAGGGCSSCGSDGGCSSCGSGKVDMRNYFAHLRSKMEERHQRTSLL